MLKRHSLKCGLILSALSLCLLTACAPIQPSTPKIAKVAQNSMKIKTRASSFIYLDPIPKDQRTVYISVQNDSGSDVFDVKPWLTESLESKFFTIVDNVDSANVVIRANVLRVGKVQEDSAQTLLDSEFGNSTQILPLEAVPGATKPLPNNDGLVLDLQYFERHDLINPEEVKPRNTMAGLTDIQLLLLCNTNHWERFQTRIVSIIFGSSASLSDKLNVLGQSAEKANTDIVRGLA